MINPAQLEFYRANNVPFDPVTGDLTFTNSDVLGLIAAQARRNNPSALPGPVPGVGGGEEPGGPPGPTDSGQTANNSNIDIGPQTAGQNSNFNLSNVGHAIDMGLGLFGAVSPNPISIVNGLRQAFTGGRNLFNSVRANSAQSIPDSQFTQNTTVRTPQDFVQPEVAFDMGQPTGLPDSNFNVNTNVTTPSDFVSPETSFDFDPTGTATGSPSASGPTGTSDAPGIGISGAPDGPSGTGTGSGEGDGGPSGDGGSSSGDYGKGGIVKRPASRAKRVSDFESKFGGRAV